MAPGTRVSSAKKSAGVPFTRCLRLKAMLRSSGVSQAVNQVVVWMRLVRERYPYAQLIQVEPYPALSAADQGWWLRALHDACAAHGLPILDFFVLDHDWTAPGWSFPEIAQVQAQSRALGVPDTPDKVPTH